MKKTYITPEIKRHMAGCRSFLDDVHMSGGSTQALFEDSAAKEREVSFTSATDGGESNTGGFGSDNGPWESLW